MTIISISLTAEILNEIDKLQQELGFSGRSEVMRAGARMLLADNKEKENLEGRLNSVLLLIHTQKDKCLEVFILEGDAERVKQLVRLFRASGKMDYVKLIVA